jgi:membrane protein DedA with SNARE-associated domain
VPIPELLDLTTASALLQQWGYGLVFVAMLLENAGLPLPGETITLLGGYAAGSGHLNLMGVVAAATSGAILGDNLGYWLGRRLGWAVMLRLGRLLRQSDGQMEEMRVRFLLHAGKSVFLGRFVAVLRVIAGPMAGAVGMPYRKFLLCNAAGALVWATTMVSLAWLGGRWIPFQSMAKGVVEFGLGALVLVVLLLLIPRLMSRLEDKSQVKHGEICEPVAETGESL